MAHEFGTELKEHPTKKVFDKYGNYNFDRTTGPHGLEYLSVGDKVGIRLVDPDADGYYKVQLSDDISGNVLFEMDNVKF